MTIKISTSLFHQEPVFIAGIIFDCDGVMIDSLLGNRAFYNTILASLNLPPMTQEQESYAFMSTAIDALTRMVPTIYHGRLEEIIKNNIDYDRDVLPKIKLMPGFLEFITLCHQHGLRLAIDTNRTDYGIARVLEFFNLPPWFSLIATSSNTEPKPSPQGVLNIAQAWHVPPAECLFLGDSKDDMTAATQAGARFVSFKNTSLAPCPIVESYNQFAERLFTEA